MTSPLGGPVPFAPPVRPLLPLFRPPQICQKSLHFFSTARTELERMGILQATEVCQIEAGRLSRTEDVVNAIDI